MIGLFGAKVVITKAFPVFHGICFLKLFSRFIVYMDTEVKSSSLPKSRCFLEEGLLRVYRFLSGACWPGMKGERDLKIIFGEIKKILRWDMVGLTLVMTVFLAYLLFFFYRDFSDRSFGDHGNRKHVELLLELADRYGEELSEEELGELEGQMEELSRDLSGFLLDFPLARENGITSYYDLVMPFAEIGENDISDEIRRKERLQYEITEYLNKQAPNLMERFRYYRSIASGQKSGAAFRDSLPDTAKERIDRYPEMDEIIKEYTVHLYEKDNRASLTGLFDESVLYGTSGYFKNIGILLVFSVLFLTAPLMAGDRVSGVEQHMCSSRTGRKIWGCQFTGVLFTAFLITTLYLMLSGAVFMVFGTWRLVHHNIHGIASHMYVFMSYGKYLLLLFAQIYLLVLGCSGINYCIMSLPGRYIAMVFKLTVLIMGSVWLTDLCLKDFLMVGNRITQTFGRSYASLWYPLCISGLLCITGIAAGYAAARVNAGRQMR